MKTIKKITAKTYECFGGRSISNVRENNAQQIPCVYIQVLENDKEISDFFKTHEINNDFDSNYQGEFEVTWARELGNSFKYVVLMIRLKKPVKFEFILKLDSISQFTVINQIIRNQMLYLCENNYEGNSILLEIPNDPEIIKVWNSSYLNYQIKFLRRQRQMSKKQAIKEIQDLKTLSEANLFSKII